MLINQGSKSHISLSVDIGGTFTDIIVDGPAGRLSRKVLTTTEKPELGLMKGAGELLNTAGLDFVDVDVFVHGTTLATNAVLERKGARTALIATEGFRDVLEIGTEGRFNQYDLQLSKPIPLVPRHLRFAVRERIDARGAERIPVTSADLPQLAAKLRSEGIESVAIALLHSYINPCHEEEVAAALAVELDGISISLSSDVCPEIREYERTSTVVANAYVKPLIDGYLRRMSDALSGAGFRGRLYLVTSGGGLTSIDTARRYPVRLIESGPAGGAIYAARRATSLGYGKVVSFDMGGTTAKICFIKDGEPRSTSNFEVDRTHRFMKGSGLPLRIPSIDLVEIGAGGGSIAKVDRLNRITVGPESAGSNPGPACYPNGGADGTVTDACLTIGLLDSESFAGGRISLNADSASAALAGAVGDRIGLTPQLAAHAVYDTVCESMASAVRVHAAEQGEAIADFTMIAFGGAAPLHAVTVAEKVGIRQVVVPSHAGVGSAVGFLEAPRAFELVQSKYMAVEDLDERDVESLLDDMSAEARSILTGGENMQLVERRTAYMRYVGQGHEIAVDVPSGGPKDSTWFRAAFESQYERQFTRFIPNAAIEILSWSVHVSTPRKPVDVQVPLASRTKAAPTGIRKVYDGTRACWIDADIYYRARLKPGEYLQGPAIVIEDETSTYVSARYLASIAPDRCIILQRSDVRGDRASVK